MKWFAFITAVGVLSLNAAEAATATGPANFGETSLVAALIRMIGSLAVVLAIFGAGLWAYKRGSRFLDTKRGPSQIHVLEARSIGNRQALYLVSCQNERLLIGSSQQGLTLIAKLPEATEDAAAILRPVEQTPTAPFLEALQHAIGRARS